MKLSPIRILGLALVCLLATATMYAGNADMYFQSADGQSYQGVASYPYYISTQGIHGPLQDLMCIFYNEHITNGETWQATPFTIPQYAAANPGAAQQYDQVAWLFTQEASHSNDSGINAAAWDIIEPGSVSLDGNAQNWYNAATGKTYAAGSFGNVTVYIPIAGTQSYDGEPPQQFLGYTPEPGTLFMMGSGLVGLAGVLRRKVMV